MAAMNETLAELLRRRLAEMGEERGRHEPLTLLEAYEHAPDFEGRVSYEVMRRVGKGHSNITDRSARTLAGMLEVPLDVVMEAAGRRAPLETFHLPPEADRLNERERAAVLAVVDAILYAAEGRSQATDAYASPKPTKSGLARVQEQRKERIERATRKIAGHDDEVPPPSRGDQSETTPETDHDADGQADVHVPRAAQTRGRTPREFEAPDEGA